MSRIVPAKAREIEAAILRLEELAAARHDSDLHEGKTELDADFCPGCLAMNALRGSFSYSIVRDRKTKAISWLLGIRDTKEVDEDATAKLSAFQGKVPGSAGLVAQMKALLGVGP